MSQTWNRVLRLAEVLGAIGMLSGTAVMAWQVPIVVSQVNQLPTKDWIDGKFRTQKYIDKQQTRRIDDVTGIAKSNFGSYQNLRDVVNIMCFNARQHDLPINCLAKDRDAVWVAPYPYPSPKTRYVRAFALHDKRTGDKPWGS